LADILSTNAKFQLQAKDTTPSGYAAASNAILAIDSGTATNGVINLIGGGDLGLAWSNTNGEYDAAVEYLGASRAMRFATAGGERMRITSDGKVGIGVPTPASKLHVAGAIMAGDASSSVTGATILRSRELSDEYRVVLGAMRSSGASFFSQSLIADPVNADTFLGGRSGTISGGAWVIGSDGGTKFISAESQTMAVGSTVTTKERLRIAGDGKVGIGESNPLSQVVIYGPTQATYKTVLGVFSSDTFGQNVGAGIGLGGRISSATGGSHFAQIAGLKENSIDSDTKGILDLQTRGTDGLTSRANINSVGNMKIGGTGACNPAAKLEVDSTTQGFLPPRVTTTQKNAIPSPVAGLLVYDTTLNKMCFYDSTIWQCWP